MNAKSTLVEIDWFGFGIFVKNEECACVSICDLILEMPRMHEKISHSSLEFNSTINSLCCIYEKKLLLSIIRYSIHCLTCRTLQSLAGPLGHFFKRCLFPELFCLSSEKNGSVNSEYQHNLELACVLKICIYNYDPISVPSGHKLNIIIIISSRVDFIASIFSLYSFFIGDCIWLELKISLVQDRKSPLNSIFNKLTISQECRRQHWLARLNLYFLQRKLTFLNKHRKSTKKIEYKNLGLKPSRWNYWSRYTKKMNFQRHPSMIAILLFSSCCHRRISKHLIGQNVMCNLFLVFILPFHGT